jgi:coenzyme F420 biosynthesis associated uncharacterized protein
MIDWTMAERVAGFVAQEPSPDGVTLIDLAPVVADSRERVVAYTGLQPQSPLPAPEIVDRRGWAATNLAGLRPVLDPLADRISDQGPLAAPLRSAAGVVLSGQVGLITGYLAQRVMGQYELALLDPQVPARLLFVAPNLAAAARALGADREELTRWVAFHEVTHAVQFGSVAWLRPHLAGILEELLADIELSVDAGAMGRLPSLTDMRDLVDAVREGGLVALVARGRRRELIDNLQATMAVVEGYAEHVMDAAGAAALPSLPRLRAALDLRRRERPPLMRLLERLLGLDLKLRQYEIGKRFCDAVVAAGGIAALNHVWTDPDALPSLAELDDPEGWLARTQVRIVTN